MSTFNKHYKELEHHAIEMTLSHIRISTPAQMKKIVASIDAHGQLSPVIVVPTSRSNCYTLMDGYLRVQAMKKLRHDIVKAEVWGCSEADALLSLLVRQGQRTWEIFEEAQALRELQIRYLNLNAEKVNIFFKLIDMRYGKKPTIVTTNLPFDAWYDVFKQKDLVDALLDRFRHYCIAITIDGPSLREVKPTKTKQKKAMAI